jgi:hypothetical protein
MKRFDVCGLRPVLAHLIRATRNADRALLKLRAARADAPVIRPMCPIRPKLTTQEAEP